MLSRGISNKRLGFEAKWIKIDELLEMNDTKRLAKNPHLIMANNDNTFQHNFYISRILM